MLNLFNKIIRQTDTDSKNEESHQALYAPNTTIAYDAELLDTLKSEHTEIRKLIGKIVISQKKNNYKQVRALLFQLKSKLTDHLLKENIRLFVYLKHMTKNNKSLYKSVQHSQHEMTMISRKILNFIDHWKNATDTQLHDNFLDKFNSIVLLLIERVRNEEEELYAAYRPPHEYTSNEAEQNKSNAHAEHYSWSEDVTSTL